MTYTLSPLTASLDFASPKSRLQIQNNKIIKMSFMPKLSLGFLKWPLGNMKICFSILYKKEQ